MFSSVPEEAFTQSVADNEGASFGSPRSGVDAKGPIVASSNIEHLGEADGGMFSQWQRSFPLHMYRLQVDC